MNIKELSHNPGTVNLAVDTTRSAVIILALLILALCTNSYGALFDPPLQNASFEDYELASGSYRPGVETWYNYGWTWEEHELAGDFPLTPYGDQWCGIGNGGVVYQQFGTWDTQQEYEINLLLGHRGGREWGQLEISIWVGGDPANAADAVTLATVGASQVDSITINPFTSQPVSYTGTAPATVTLNSGAGFDPGDPLWIQFTVTGGAQNFIDNVEIESSIGVINPYPENNAVHVDPSGGLTWQTEYVSGEKFNVYFGTDPDSWDVELLNYTQTSYNPQLDYATEYYWRVDIVVGGQTYPGQLWSFITGGKASDPVPVDAAAGLSIGLVDLAWTGDSFATHYKVYTGTSLPLTEIGQVDLPAYNNLHITDELTIYNWRIDTYIDDQKITEGDTWSFSTGAKPRPCIPADLNGDCRVNFDDLLILADNWLDDTTPVADLTNDNKVDVADLAVMAENWRNIGTLSIVINEFVAVNKSTAPLTAGELLDEDGESSDWIEIRNLAGAAVNLRGWYLTNSKNDLTGWKFPDVTIGADGYLVVFASGKNRRDPDSELHTDFMLQGTGEYLALVKPDDEGETAVYDYDNYPQQYPHISFGLSGSTTVSQTVLIEEHIPATAYIPTDDSLGLTWTEVDFVESGWLTGQTGIGYDINPTYTPYIGLDVLAMENVNETVYVRIPFEVTDVDSIDTLTLRMRFEDGFVAYLNGANVVAQDNNPDVQQLTWDSGASGNRDDGVAVVQQEFDITVYRGLLRKGANVLAIHGLNWQTDSSDLLILPQLAVVRNETIDVGAMTRGYFSTPTPGAANDAAFANPGPSIIDMTDNPPRPANNQYLAITANIEEALVPIDTVTLHYRVMYNSEVSLQMFDNGAGDDAAAGDGIYTATIPANASGPGQMVRWYVTASDVQGRSSRCPLFPYPNDSAEYSGTVIVDPSTESLLPTIEWFTTNPSGTEGNSGARASVYYDGLFYDNMWIHNRGGSTATASTTSGMRKAHFKFNFNTGHKFRYHRDFPKVDEFNLNHTYSDKAYLRQPLAFEFYDRCGCPGSYSFPMRTHRNGQFFALMAFIEEPEEEMLEREGLDPRGALYKMYNTFTSPSGEKKTREWEGTADLSAFMNGMNQSGTARHNYIFDAIDMPRMIGYLVGTVFTHQNDHPHKNHYLYRDTEGTGEWFFMPWDHDLTWGSNWTGSSYLDYIYAADDQVSGRSANVKPSHPFIGKADCQEWNGFWNRLTDKLLNDTTFREMYLRRLRTLMDEILKAPGTPYDQLVIEKRLDEMVAEMQATVAEDAQRWLLGPDNWSWGGQGGYPRRQTFLDAINIIKDGYLAVRRTHLFVTHNVDRANLYPIANSYSARIPNAQPDSPVVIIDSYVEHSPPTFNQDEEYIRLDNPNSYAVDISGWKLTDAVRHTFLAGTVIPAGSSIYVSPNVAAFRARPTSPTGNQGHFVQGNYKGHLSSWGETINLYDKEDTLVHARTYQGDPSDTQRYLRISEMMYHPADDGGYSDPEQLEYIELKNIGPDPLTLNGVRFTEGITYDFPPGTIIGGQQYIILAKDPVAFVAYYQDVPGGTAVFGPYSGQLGNGGENVKLEDMTNSTIIEFDYNDNWFEITDGLGFSLTIKDVDNPDLDSWDSKSGWWPSAEIGGSPGQDDPDTILDPDSIVISEIMTHTNDPVYGDWIEIWNRTGSPVYIGGWFLSDSTSNLKKYEIADNDPRAVISSNSYVVFDSENDFRDPDDPGSNVQFGLDEHGEDVYLTSGAGGVLTGQYSTEQKNFGAAENGVSIGMYFKSDTSDDFVRLQTVTKEGANNNDPIIGPVVISELMYNPQDPDADSDAEYIELTNLTGSTVDLYDPANPANTWQIKGVKYTFPLGVTLSANETILVTRGDPAQFRTTYSIPGSIDIYGPYDDGDLLDGKLDNGGEKVTLIQPGAPDPLTFEVPEIRIDRVNYSDGSHPEPWEIIDPWPVSADGDSPGGLGHSLHRKVLADYGNDHENWQASPPSPGTIN